jgi:hypothetical protein
MEDEKPAGKKRRFIRTHTIGTFALVLAIVVSLGLSWQLFEYRGLMAYLAEWQFAHLRRFYPLVTIALLTLLIEIPLIIVLIVRSRASRTEYLLIEEPTALLTRSRLAYRELLFVAAGVAIAALALGIYANSIGMTATARQISAAKAQGPVPSGTRVQMTGALRLDRIALYESDSLFFDRSLKVAPLQVAPDQPVRFLVEVDARQPGPVRNGKIAGVAASTAVPGPLVSLYRDAGFRIADKPTLIVTSLETVRMPFIRTAWTLAAIALLIFAVGMAERYWYKHLNRQYLAWKDQPAGMPAPQRKEWWSTWGWHN